MAIFVSKRLLRFGLLAGVCVALVLFLTSSSQTDQSSLSDLIPSMPKWSSPSLFGGSQSDSPLTAEEKDAEKLREETEKALLENHADPNAVPLDEQTMDQGAKALKDAAENLGEAGKAEALKDPAADSKKPEAIANPNNDPARDMETDPAAKSKALGSTWEFMAPSYAKKGQRPKACFVSLVRNSELSEILPSIKDVERRFNSKYHYPWVFLNDEPFTDHFKLKVTEAVSGEIEFGLVPKEHWSYPNFVDQEKAAEERKKMEEEGVIYGGMESYRHMCRFQSGFFWRQKALDKFDWYWRVEPSTKLYCDINYDVFQWMQDNEKVYGFTITIHEYERTIRTLWSTVKKFLNKYPSVISKDNLMKFISGDRGKTYNLCHFWSNFEIANLNFWRSPAYREYFNYLDQTGGFFYERWGDAPVHSIAASLFLPRDKLHYFSDIGYHHIPYDNCPLDDTVFTENKCDCDRNNDFTFQSYSCGVEYYDAQGMKKPQGWEKYRQ
ncbi:hypothetical protein HG536_0H01360 [Torulaspora globosa]|uniref:Glycosyltransferase family 15 protein n=1 Tax=Torulaspora globosa TaxID=48254 RepID=A0A7G3ZMM5_9SACH|nr:uncharacterized protein HG536_0H01360 [Torulaspora globosa]QLL34761.1 hypothetical protein HG536_0H01360 [Torulaspora globosa]